MSTIERRCVCFIKEETRVRVKTEFNGSLNIVSISFYSQNFKKDNLEYVDIYNLDKFHEHVARATFFSSPFVDVDVLFIGFSTSSIGREKTCPNHSENPQEFQFGTSKM